MSRRKIEIEKDVCNEYIKTDLSNKEIALKYNTSPATIYRILKKHNKILYKKTGKKDLIDINDNYFKTQNSE